MRLIISLLFVLALGAQTAVQAQEGYPMNGTWRGEWGPADGEKTLVVLVMEFDGSDINGTINPGRDSIEFDDARLDPSDWTVHIEASSREGEAIVIEGTLMDIGSYNRTIEGTWTQRGETYQFQITRE